MSKLRDFALAGAASASLILSSCLEENSSSASSAPKIISTKIDSSITIASFQTLCDSVGGLVQDHATCAGNNSCKGLSFNSSSFQLTEHSCKGMNSCGGFSCIDLPKDQGRSGPQIFSATCAGCHGSESNTFSVMIPAGTDTSSPTAHLSSYSDRAIEEIIGFGRIGYSNSGDAYASMPAQYQNLSLAEIQRLRAYIRTLQPVLTTFNPYP